MAPGWDKPALILPDHQDKITARLVVPKLSKAWLGIDLLHKLQDFCGGQNTVFPAIDAEGLDEAAGKG